VSVFSLECSCPELQNENMLHEIHNRTPNVRRGIDVG
jgi:hypothetical protein